MANSKNKTRDHRLIATYAGLAALLIFAFQLYWLYSTYTTEEAQLADKLDTGLREYILSNDTRSLLSSGNTPNGLGLTIPPTAFSKDSAQSPIKGVDVEIQMLDSTKGLLSDSLTKKLIDSVLGLSNIPRTDSLAANTYVSGLRAAYPGMRFSLLAKGKRYPDAPAEAAGLKVNATSQINPMESYTLEVYNPGKTVIAKMWGAIGISAIYLGVCLSAVYLLVRNIRKNRLLMDAKDNFTQNMTHELKTPLATLSAAAEALHNYNFIENKEVAHEYLAIMMNDIRKLDTMTSAILTNARLNDNTITMHPEIVNLRELVDEVLANFRPRMATLDAGVIVAIDMAITLTADKLHLGNVFSNLVDNALKYSNNKPELTITAGVHGSSLYITVKDNGIGIHPAYHKEIFNPYVRVHEGDLHSVKGFGIGLTYAREIVQRHHGTIKIVHSEKDKGTTFEIILPLHHE